MNKYAISQTLFYAKIEVVILAIKINGANIRYEVLNKRTGNQFWVAEAELTA